MKKALLITLAAGAIGASTFAVLAADDPEFASQIEARQAFMKVYRFNIAVLGAMAREKVPYDAEAASAAAGNLLAASKMKNAAMWPAGSDMGAEGYEGITSAKAELWSDYPDVNEKSQAMTEALEAMAAAAGDGLDGLRSNIGAVGNGCKGCHEAYRADKN